MSRSRNAAIVRQALAARTEEQANQVQSLIEQALGGQHKRPVGDRPNNIGLLTASGSNYDHRLLELVTNMQDAVLDRWAIRNHGNVRDASFASPHVASEALLADMTDDERARQVTVTLSKSGSRRRSVTVVARDLGSGMTASQIPDTIFHLGASYKDGIPWQQGKFGLGGATTLRNARAAVLVSRRDPELLAVGERDHVSIAVVQWERHHSMEGAFYLVDRPWTRAGDDAQPFSVPAEDFPQFEAGTQLALIAYETQNVARRSGDERSFQAVCETRLFKPVMPISYRNELVRPRVEVLRGLDRRLMSNPSANEGSETLPFNLDGTTYHLPVRYRIFEKPGDAGERRSYVAHGHALIVTSNGQVHYHWDGQTFRHRTELKKLYNRILVIVESDVLPLETRTALFTADRSQLVRGNDAHQLEEAIISHLNGSPELKAHNVALIAESIRGDNSTFRTAHIAEKISRALRAKGIGGTGAVSPEGSTRIPNAMPAEDLYADPTHLEGPEKVEAVIGKTKNIFLKLNAVDGFIPNRTTLRIECDHVDIGPSEVTFGRLSSGRLRVAVAVPAHLDPESCALDFTIEAWPRTSGGIGSALTWTTKLTLVDEQKPPNRPRPNRRSGQGPQVAVLWRSHANSAQPDWDALTVGEIESIPGRVLAQESREYADLADIQDDVLTLVLNREQTWLKDYIAARARASTDRARQDAEERYAVGVGVGLLMLHKAEQESAPSTAPIDSGLQRAAQSAIAKAVLSVLPEFDALARETGYDERE